jgi:hypothetical protein
MWEHRFLKHKDAIHVASAVYHNIPVMNTFDGDLLGTDRKIKRRNEDNFLRIERPPLKRELSLFNGKKEKK